MVLIIAFASGPAMAQVYSGAGAQADGAGQATTGTYVAAPGGTQTFSLGTGYMYSMETVSLNDVSRLQSMGVRTIVVPAGSTVHITVQTGQPIDIRTAAPGQAPNMIVFGPGGFVGVGVFAGPGTGAFAGTGPVVSAGAGAGVAGTGVSTIAIPGGSMQMYSFTGTPGQAFLITQQAGGTIDRVLVVFQ